MVLLREGVQRNGRRSSEGCFQASHARAAFKLATSYLVMPLWLLDGSKIRRQLAVNDLLIPS